MPQNTMLTGMAGKTKAPTTWVRAIWVAHTGFEPVISALRGRRPGPLDECALPSISVSGFCIVLQASRACQAIFSDVWPFICAMPGPSAGRGGPMDSERVVERAPVAIDPGNFSDAEREQRGIKRLPETLDSALDALQADSVLMEALGPALAPAYLAVKRLESSFFADTLPEEETRQHFYKY